MEESFYSRATGRLRKASKSSYSTRWGPKKDDSSVYSLGDNEDDCVQYPTGVLSHTQRRFLCDFISGICNVNEPQLDPEMRSIHMMGYWQLSEYNITVSISILQPHVTNATIGLSGMNYFVAKQYAQNLNEDIGTPDINRTTKYCQLLGKYSILFADYLIDKGFIREDKVSWNMTVISQTEPIFCVVQNSQLYECKLTHSSCQILKDANANKMSISAPTSTGHNFTFRSIDIRTGGGTGPSITVHSSGILQYQGGPRHIKTVCTGFYACIESVMRSSLSIKFLRSLALMRTAEVP